MICIRCGKEFTATRGNVACTECRNDHLKTIGAVDATTNITKAEAIQLKSIYESWATATQMLIDGATLADIGTYMGKTSAKVSYFFSGQIRYHVRNERYVSNKKDSVEKPSLVYKPQWPENLYCAVFHKKCFPNMPPDAQDGIAYVLEYLPSREEKILSMRFQDGMALEEIGTLFELTRERIRKLEATALRRLNSQNLCRWLLKGAAACQREDREAEALQTEQSKRIAVAEEQAAAARRVMGWASLKKLNLDARSYNCLLRANCKNVMDVADLGHKGLSHIHGLGVKSVNNVEAALRDYYNANEKGNTP